MENGMEDRLPEVRLQCTIVGGRTAASASGKALKYLAGIPFQTDAQQKQAKQNLETGFAAEIVKAGSC